jgi:hypothetical protein
MKRLERQPKSRRAKKEKNGRANNAMLPVQTSS